MASKRVIVQQLGRERGGRVMVAVYLHLDDDDDV
jgi:hypothetical protein